MAECSHCQLHYNIRMHKLWRRYGMEFMNCVLMFCTYRRHEAIFWAVKWKSTNVLWCMLHYFIYQFVSIDMSIMCTTWLSEMFYEVNIFYLLNVSGTSIVVTWMCFNFINGLFWSEKALRKYSVINFNIFKIALTF